MESPPYGGVGINNDLLSERTGLDGHQRFLSELTASEGQLSFLKSGFKNFGGLEA